MLLKYENIDTLQEQLNATVPDDTIVNAAHISIASQDNDNYLIHSNDTFKLNDWSLSQLIKHLGTNLQLKHFSEFPADIRERMLNHSINISKNKKLYGRYLIRSTQEREEGYKKAIAFLTSYYKPVNHKDLFELMKKTIEKTNEFIFGDIDYEYCVVRVPIKKISDNGLGVYWGINFVNGQIGSVPLKVSSMLWEKICTNGAVSCKSKNTFIDTRHIGNNFYYDLNKLGGWANDSYLSNKFSFEVYSKTIIPKVSNFVLEKMPEKYGLVTKEFSKGLYNYLKVSDKRVIETGSTSLWVLMTGITKLSQEYDDYKRYEFDSLAEVVVEDYLNN